MQKLKAVVPSPMDVSSITTEETEVVVGNLPRGTCVQDGSGPGTPTSDRICPNNGGGGGGGDNGDGDGDNDTDCSIMRALFTGV